MKQPIEITNEQVGQELDMWFKKEECEALARETGFIQRRTSRLTGSSFFNLLTVGILDEPTVSYEGLCDILEERHPDVQITPQALRARMNSEGAVEFLKAGLARALKETASQPLAAPEETDWLAAFPRVLLQDSTYMQIHEKMADDFKGSGGNASTAAIKVDYSYDVKNEQAEHLAIRQGADSDQGFAEDLAARVQKNDLVIRDLGYFCLDFFAHLVLVGAFFLSRLSFNVNVYLAVDADEPVKLTQHINRSGGGKTMEFNVFLGQKQRIPIRLIVYRLPPEAYRKRQKAAIKAAKRKGRGISLSYLKFLKYTFYITNVPANLWPMEAVGTVYRLRWQVELAFKHWKSLFRINVLQGTRTERILCLIYGRLIVILVAQRLLALASTQAEGQQRELSFAARQESSSPQKR